MAVITNETYNTALVKAKADAKAKKALFVAAELAIKPLTVGGHAEGLPVPANANELYKAYESAYYAWKKADRRAKQLALEIKMLPVSGRSELLL